MCRTNPLMNTPMPKHLYDTWERNQAHEQPINCSSCTPRMRRRCLGKMNRNNKGSDGNPLPKEKALTIEGRTKRNQPSPQIERGRILRRHGFKTELTGKVVGGRKQFKVIPIIYGRLVSRYSQQIHE